ncbi:uncharacterized protein LOC128578966 [Nycticebus coucang]|uniref:uncharacterized protein LOC128578966 n=1 Tax=Nycticebus coucang TaxID=9470 RepID=UPI00234CDBE1|nr:uncharacterized protein LOC128578966 [Nycticebus coucang]
MKVQQGSPVFCVFGSHWELVGLVSETSVACYKPILVIKTAPYISWMRWLIKAFQNPLDPIFSLPCSFLTGVKQDSQKRHSRNRSSAPSASHTLSTSPLNRQRRNPTSIIFGSTTRVFFPGNRQLYLKSSQLSSASKFPMILSWTSPIAKPWDSFTTAEPSSTLIADTFQSLGVFGPQSPQTADISTPWDFPQKSVIQCQYQIMTDMVRSSIKPLTSTAGLHTIPLFNADGSSMLFSNDMDGTRFFSGISAVPFQVQSSKVPSLGQLVAKPWLEFTPNVGTSAQFVPCKMGTVIQIQSTEEFIRTQLYHVVDKVNTGLNTATLHPWASLIVNKIELWAHSALKEEESHKPILTHTLESWFQPILNIFRTQEPVENTDGYQILPESKSTKFWTASTLNIPFSLAQSSSDTTKSQAQYKANMIRPSNEMKGTNPLSNHKTVVLESQRQPEDTTWLSIHHIEHVIESTIHSKVDTIKLWAESDAHIIQNWIQPETQSEKLLTQRISDTTRSWQQTTTERIKPWIQSKQKMFRSRTKTEKIQDKNMPQPEADIIRLWAQTETETIIPWNQPESNTIKAFFSTKLDHVKPTTHPDFKTVYPWSQPDIDIIRLWTQAEFSSIQQWKKPETFAFRPGIQSEVKIVIPLSKLKDDIVTFWFPSETDAIETGSQSESQTNLPLSEIETDRVRPWLQIQMDTFKHWIETGIQTVHPWTKIEDDIARSWTHTEGDTVKPWIQNELETVTGLTEPVTQTAHHWIQSETEIVGPWNQPLDDKLRAWIQHDIYKIRPWYKFESDEIKFWTQTEVDAVGSWIQADVNIVNPWVKNEASTLSPWTQDESLELNTLKQSKTDPFILWTQVEIPEINPWAQSEIDTVILWTQAKTPTVNQWTAMSAGIGTKTEFQELMPWRESGTDPITLWTQEKSSAVTLWTQPILNTLTLWTQDESAVLSPLTESVSDTVIPGTQEVLLAINSITNIIHNTIMLWWKDESPAVNTWVLSEFDSVSLWTQSNLSSVNPWTQTNTDTITLWMQPESLAGNLWNQFETDIITPTTNIKSPVVYLWSYTVCTQAESHLLNHFYSISHIYSTQSKTSIVTISIQDKTLELSSWTGSESDIFTPWTQAETIVASTWTKPVGDATTPWTQDNPLAIIPWSESATDTVTPWTKAEFPIGNPWTQSEIDTVSQWVPEDSIEVSLWTQTIAPIDNLWTTFEFTELNVQTEPAAHIVMPLIETESPPINLWAQSVSDAIKLWAQDRSLPVNLWMETVTSLITSETQAVFPIVNPGTKSVADNLTLWIHAEFTAVYPWMPLADMITQKPQSESSVVNLWMQHMSDTVILWPQTESPLSFGTEPLPDSFRPWPQAESSTVIHWIELVASTVTLWTQSEFLSSYPQIQSVSDTHMSWTQDESPTVNPWMQAISDMVTLWNQVTSPVNLWTQYETYVFTQWTKSESPKVSPWTKLKVDSLTLWTQANSEIFKPWTHFVVNTVTPLAKSVYLAVIPWTQFETATITSWTQTLLPAKIPLTVALTTTVTLWNMNEILSENTWTQSTTEIVTEWTKNESPEVNPFIQPISDILILFTHVINLATNHWTQSEAITITPWTPVESVEVNDWRQEAVSEAVTLWVLSEFSEVKFWAPPETDKATLWHQAVSTLASKIETVTDTFIPWTQTESPLVNPWILPLPEKVTLWTMSEYLPINTWNQAEFLSVHPKTQSEFSTVNFWTEFESSAPNPWIQAKAGKVVIPWANSESLSLNPWTQPRADKVTLCTQILSPLLNSFSQTENDTITEWSNTESLPVNTWTDAEASTPVYLTQDEYPLINTWTQPVSDTPIFDSLISWTHEESSAVNPWTQTVASIVLPSPQAVLSTKNTPKQPTSVTPCTQSEYQVVKLKTENPDYTITLWTQDDSLAVNTWTGTETSTVTFWKPTDSTVNSYIQSETYMNTFWTMFNTDSKKSWTMPEANILRISLQPQTDTTQSLILTENQVSLLVTHPEIENINTWTLPELGTLMSWIFSVQQEAINWPEYKAFISRAWFKTQTKRIRSWIQPESQTLNSFITFGDDKIKSLTQHKTSDVVSWIQTQTTVFYHWDQSEVDTMRPWTVYEANKVKLWTPTEADIVNPWTQNKTDTILTRTESQKDRPWTQSFSNTVIQLTQAEMPTGKHLTMPDINILQPWFQTKSDIVRQRSQLESKTVTTWIQLEQQLIHPWTQPETKTIRLWDQSEGGVSHPWIHAKMNTDSLRTHSEMDKIKSWIHLESQAIRTWSEDDTIILWSPTQNDGIWFQSQFESQMTHSWTQPGIGITNPWPQHEMTTIIPWTHSEINLWTHPGADKVIEYWLQTQMNSVRPWNQPERKTIQTWTQTVRQVIKPPNLTEVNTVTRWLQTQSDIARPWIQSNTESVRLWTQIEVGKVQPVAQPRVATNQPSPYAEAQVVRPWIKLKTDKPWFHIQMNKGIQWTYSESQMSSPWIQPEVGLVHHWIQSKTQAVRLSTKFETFIARSWSQVVSQVVKPLTSFEGRTLISWALPITQVNRPWTQPEAAIIASFAISKPDNVGAWIQHETEILRPVTHFKADIIASFTPPEVESDGETSLRSRFSSKHVPVSLVNTIPSPDQNFITLSLEIAAAQTQDKINSLQPNQLTSTWLPKSVDYENYGKKLQIVKTKENKHILSASLVSLSSSFSFLISCFLSSPCTSLPSCSVFSCTFPSSCIFPSCSIFSPVAFSSIPLPLASFDSPRQELSSSKLTEKTIVSHTISSLHAASTTLPTKQSPQMSVSQPAPKSKHEPEQSTLRHSELNVSLAECHLGVIWKESLQAFWLFKTAVISHETTECGLRPGLVPHCPNCWEAEMGEFPWMVSVQLSFSHFCAGSILNEQWILTTARCANFIKNSEALALVQVGLIDLQDATQAQTVAIHRAMPYLGPKGPLGPGLIFLKQPLHFQPLVLPICLEQSVEQKRNIQLYDCWLPSWSLMRGSPGILQKRHLSILQVSTCAQFWPNLNEFTFCVEAKKAMGEAGCKGDLGAPLVCHLQQKDTWVQVGILSHFDERCTKPYVFSQVSPFLLWLQGVTRPSHAPWSQHGPMTTSTSISLSVSTSTNTSAFAATPASVRPHFISLPQPQTLADRISLRYAMPWQAMIISCGSQICSGSIISSSWVLTAAHCVRNMNPEDTAVILGLRHPGAPLRVVKVSAILLHERFRLVSGTARNDLALLLLKEAQTPIQLLAPLGHLKNLNSSECWLSGPRILKPGETDENPEMLQMHVIGASSCAHLYPDIGSSIVCFITRAKGSDADMDPVIPGSAVMCKLISGNGSWRQIGFTSIKTLATIVSPHFPWILATSAKAQHPLNQAHTPWVAPPKSSSLRKQPVALPFSSIMMFVSQSFVAQLMSRHAHDHKQRWRERDRVRRHMPVVGPVRTSSEDEDPRLSMPFCPGDRVPKGSTDKCPVLVDTEKKNVISSTLIEEEIAIFDLAQKPLKVSHCHFLWDSSSCAQGLVLGSLKAATQQKEVVFRGLTVAASVLMEQSEQETFTEAEPEGAKSPVGESELVMAEVIPMVQLEEVIEGGQVMPQLAQENEREGEDNNQEEEGNGQAVEGHLAPRPQPAMEALEEVQLELTRVSARGSMDYARLKRKFGQRMKAHLERRRAIIQSIPGFWAKAEKFLNLRQIMNHPQISTIITEQDEDVLAYMTSLEVEQVSIPRHCWRMKFFFHLNPYFRNEVITKDYLLTITGYKASCSSSIQCFWDDDNEVPSIRQDTSVLSFISWLSNHNCPGSNKIAEIIIEDLWLNPLHYYRGEECAMTEKREEVRKMDLLFQEKLEEADIDHSIEHSGSDHGTCYKELYPGSEDTKTFSKWHSVSYFSFQIIIKNPWLNTLDYYLLEEGTMTKKREEVR